MQPANKKPYSFRADANALGGYLQKPFEQNIPALAPVSLPAVGGFAKARSEAFTLDDIVRCSAAYTRVSGTQYDDGSISILVTAGVEDLNLLEVVTAKLIVAQVSIRVPKDDGPPEFSLFGSRFEGLHIAGPDGFPKPGPDSLPRQNDAGGCGHACTGIRRVGLAQAAERGQKTHRWVTSDLPPEKGRDKFHSQVDGCNGTGPHKLDIPGFGRITLGQLVLTADSVRLVALRADLGCPVTGGVSISCVGGGGIHDE